MFSQFKSLLGFKEPSTAEISPEATPPPPQFPHKERVTEFAAEIGQLDVKKYFYGSYNKGVSNFLMETNA